MPERENFLNMGSTEFVKRRASDTNLGRVAQLNRDITMLDKKLTVLGTLHVLGTCTKFASLFIFPRLQAKSVDVYDSNFVGR